MSANMPAMAGADAEVPPITAAPRNTVPGNPTLSATQEPTTQTRYPSCPLAAVRDTSGRSRRPSAGTPAPVCQLGLEWMVLTPPLPDQSPEHCAGVLGAAQVSFHTISGIYPSAEVKSLPLVVDQNVASLLFSWNCVPPTATLNGVEASPFTPLP